MHANFKYHTLHSRLVGVAAAWHGATPTQQLISLNPRDESPPASPRESERAGAGGEYKCFHLLLHTPPLHWTITQHICSSGAFLHLGLYIGVLRLSFFVYLFFALQCQCIEDPGIPWIILKTFFQIFMHETYNCTKSIIWEPPLYSLLTTLLLCLRHPNHRHKSQVNPKSHPGIKMKIVFFSIPIRSEFDHEIGIVTIKMQNKMEFEMWI